MPHFSQNMVSYYFLCPPSLPSRHISFCFFSFFFLVLQPLGPTTCFCSFTFSHTNGLPTSPNHPFLDQGCARVHVAPMYAHSSCYFPPQNKSPTIFINEQKPDQEKKATTKEGPSCFSWPFGSRCIVPLILVSRSTNDALL